MVTILVIGLFSLIWIMFSKTSNMGVEHKSSITKIDDKNWIVDNEFVSFETDTPILRMQQKIEDDKHFGNYELNRLTMDRARISSYYIKTLNAINKFPDLIECVTPKKLDMITEKYNEYIQMCDNLDEQFRLTKEEFLIREENITLCVDFSTIGLKIPTPGSGIYEIHNPETARYHRGNIQEIMAEEFKIKHY